MRRKLSDLLHTGAAAHRLEVSLVTAIKFAREGRVKAFQTHRGFWLFDPNDVERLAKQRRAQREEA